MPAPSRSASPRIVTVVQARMASTRLPGKVLLPLAGKPLLVRMVERVQAAVLSGTVVVATSINPEDDVLAELCRAEDLLCYRGDPEDVLDRHYRAGQALEATTVIKIPSDVPLIDPRVIDRVISYYLAHEGDYDFVSNLHPASYPDGNDVEIMTMPALETAWREATRPLEREHTTPYLWENADRFRVGNVAWETGLDYSMSHRWTIDYPADYDFISAVYQALYSPDRHFSLEDILAYLEAHPEVAAINADYAGVNWYRHHLNELRTVTPDMTKRAGNEAPA
jgi:spore coat polysaccharide biosynthesis protein SpsF